MSGPRVKPRDLTIALESSGMEDARISRFDREPGEMAYVKADVLRSVAEDPEYDGNDLMIPWAYDTATDEWAPMINLKDGVQLSADGITYVVKGVEEGVVMQEAADASLAADLVIDTTIEPPDLTFDATKVSQVGDVPEDAELKVIRGELVE